MTALNRFHCSYKVVVSTCQKREQLRKRRLLSHFSWYTFRELSLFISLCEFFSSVSAHLGVPYRTNFRHQAKIDHLHIRSFHTEVSSLFGCRDFSCYLGRVMATATVASL